VKILILGGDGMLGHQLLSLAGRHEVYVTLRQPLDAYRQYGLFSAQNAIGGVDARNTSQLSGVVHELAPQAVINCIGLIKQRHEAAAAIPALEINSLLPHRLLEICKEAGARLVHFSTDCVFSGHRGGYRENDNPDPVDLYGRSKLLGELDHAPALTLRTSVIGLELARKLGLIEWFLAQRGTIRGFRRWMYSGMTTLEMARLVERLLERHPDLHGIWHVAAASISKYDLLVSLATKLRRNDIEIVPDDAVMCDRSLSSNAFVGATGYQAPTWDAMLTELAEDVRRRCGVQEIRN
jgi:dTDP-4-dehydrorhamnose reductase